MSGKDCGHHGKKRRKIFRLIFAGLVIFTVLVLLTILIIWLILRPTKPRFILQDATIFNFNLSSNTVSSTIQLTVTSRNPNDKIGVYYDRLDVYATYRNQQITLRTLIPPSYQGHEEIIVWSPFVSGVNVPIAPFNAVGLAQDQSNGNVMLTIMLDGRVRFKVGTFISGRYHLYVRCPVIIPFADNGNTGNSIVVGNNAVKYQLVTSCSVSV